jgi:hypothetical protein
MRKLLWTCLSVVFVLPFLLQPAVADDPGVALEGYTKVFSITENPDPENPDRVAQQVIGGLDLNQNGRQEFLYVTDLTFIGGREEDRLGYALFLYEYDPAEMTYVNIWSYTIDHSVGGSFPVFTIGDLDGDGNQEIILPIQYGADLPEPGANPDRLLVFEFGPDSMPEEPTATWNFDAPAGSNTRPSAILASNLDGGDRDMLAVGFRAFNGQSVGMMIVGVEDEFAGPLTSWEKFVYDTTTSTGSMFGTIQVTDLDNNGKPEFTFAVSNGLAFVYELEDDGTFTRYDWNLSEGETGIGGTILSLAHADLNGDGNNELIYGNSGSSQNRDVFIVTGLPALADFDASYVHRLGRTWNHDAVYETDPVGIEEFRGLTAGDYDDNGLTDIFMNNGGRVWRVEYSGSGAVTDSASYTWTPIYEDTTLGTRFRWVTFTGDNWSQSQGVTGTDMSGNGVAEILVANQRGGSASTGAAKIVIIEADAETNVVIDPNSGVAQTFRLEQNYPNPFNPSTTIEFTTSISENVKLEVYDITGRKVATLLDQWMPQGQHSAVFDASNLSSGTYMYVLTVGQHRMNRKMVLMK